MYIHVVTYSLSTLATYSRRFRRQFVTENGDCRRKRRQSPFSVIVWTVWTRTCRTHLLSR